VLLNELLGRVDHLPRGLQMANTSGKFTGNGYLYYWLIEPLLTTELFFSIEETRNIQSYSF
jgi:hypothetical protein